MLAEADCQSAACMHKSRQGSVGATGRESYLSSVQLLEYHSPSQGHRLPRHGEVGEGGVRELGSWPELSPCFLEAVNSSQLQAGETPEHIMFASLVRVDGRMSE